MPPQNNPDRIRIVFDDRRLVANAGLLLPAALAQHLGLRELVDHHLDLGGAPGRANWRQDNDAGRLGAGGRRLHRRCRRVAHRRDSLHPGQCGQSAPSTLGTFLRSFRWGHAANWTEPPVAGPSGRLGPDPATRHSPSTLIRSARPTDWPRRERDTMATPAPGAITRCWPSPPEPATC